MSKSTSTTFPAAMLAAERFSFYFFSSWSFLRLSSRCCSMRLMFSTTLDLFDFIFAFVRFT